MPVRYESHSLSVSVHLPPTRENARMKKRNEMSVNYDLSIHIPDLTDNLVFIVNAITTSHTNLLLTLFL